MVMGVHGQGAAEFPHTNDLPFFFFLPAGTLTFIVVIILLVIIPGLNLVYMHRPVACLWRKQTSVVLIKSVGNASHGPVPRAGICICFTA